MATLGQVPFTLKYLSRKIIKGGVVKQILQSGKVWMIVGSWGWVTGLWGFI